MGRCKSCGSSGGLGRVLEYSWRRGGKWELQCLACYAMLRGADAFVQKRITDESFWRPLSELPVDDRWCLVKKIGYSPMPHFRLALFDQPVDLRWGGERMWLDADREPLRMDDAERKLSAWAYWPGTEPKEAP
jgi:hypothetical protein